MTHAENPANPVVTLIERAMNQVPDKKLKSVALAIDYSYNNLWGVYREWRNMPVLPLLRLCKFMGLNEAQAFELFQEQPEPRNKAPRYEKTGLDEGDIVFGEGPFPVTDEHRNNPRQHDGIELDEADMTFGTEPPSVPGEEK